METEIRIIVFTEDTLETIKEELFKRLETEEIVELLFMCYPPWAGSLVEQAAELAGPRFEVGHPNNTEYKELMRDRKKGLDKYYAKIRT